LDRQTESESLYESCVNPGDDVKLFDAGETKTPLSSAWFVYFTELI
jgi:hypothetical protein